MIEFEHTILIILLLSGVLYAKPPRQLWAILITLTGMLLVFIPPSQTIIIAWDLIFGIVVPLLLWQNVRRLVNAEWRGWKSVTLWMVSVLIFSFAFWLGSVFDWPSAILFGVIVASMIWRASEPDKEVSFMSLVGPLSLVFLLTEVEGAIQSPDHYLGSIFSGAFFGLVAALLGLNIIRKVPAKYHSWIGIGQMYLAYSLAFFAGISAIAATMVSAIVFVWLNQYFKLGFDKTTPLAPLNTWPGYSFVLLLFLLLGWQAHQPISTLFIIEVVVGVIIGLGITWLGHRWEIPAFQKQGSVWMAGLRIALLLFPALLLWPRDILQEPLQLAVAIGLTVLVIGMSHLGLLFYFPKTGEPY